jgi:hypothetical protein
MLRRRQWIALLSLTLVGASVAAGASSPAAQTKKQAEVNVLRAVPREWSAKQLPGLVTPRTHLLVDNTEALCHGRGHARAGHRFTHFVCVVRPHVHTRRQGLHVAYRALRAGRFRIRWLFYRRH